MRFRSIGVNILVFMLFFFVNSPDDMARAHLDRNASHRIRSTREARAFPDLPLTMPAGDALALAAKTKENTAEFATAGDGIMR
jgi:hypothetical protein